MLDFIVAIPFSSFYFDDVFSDPKAMYQVLQTLVGAYSVVYSDFIFIFIFCCSTVILYSWNMGLSSYCDILLGDTSQDGRCKALLSLLSLLGSGSSLCIFIISANY